MFSFERLSLLVAGLLGAAGVAAAAAAAHIGNDPLLAPLALVALTHAPALLALALHAPAARLMRIATALLALGAVVFCGELGFHYLTGSAALTPVAPFGGGALIAGWLVLAVSALIDPRRAA